MKIFGYLITHHCTQLPYSGKFSMGANFPRFSADQLPRNKTAKKITKMEIDEWRRHYMLRTSSRVNERLSTVCLPSWCKWSDRCRAESACYHTKCQWIRKRRSEPVVVEINSAESFCSTSQFLTHSGSLDTFVNKAVVAEACLFALRSASICMWGVAITWDCLNCECAETQKIPSSDQWSCLLLSNPQLRYYEWNTEYLV